MIGRDVRQGGCLAAISCCVALGVAACEPCTDVGCSDVSLGVHVVFESKSFPQAEIELVLELDDWTVRCVLAVGEDQNRCDGEGMWIHRIPDAVQPQIMTWTGAHPERVHIVVLQDGIEVASFHDDSMTYAKSEVSCNTCRTARVVLEVPAEP